MQRVATPVEHGPARNDLLEFIGRLARFDGILIFLLIDQRPATRRPWFG